ncbi:hypothetical protein [Agarilytica rhodophyticola]|uniref:hypothetical protein n=1 Tax=Agarilytica rhodophyticola TaxID=1737490 RepID=UPI000B342DA1|nr:hypothetical protein [Agarilytica rhodophyticola]
MLTASILFLLALAMVIGPVMMIQPSPGMKRIAKLRSLANQQGFNIALKPPKNTEKVIGATYSLLCKKPLQEQKNNNTWHLEKKSHSHDIHFYGKWDWLGSNCAPERQWPQLERILHDIVPGITELEFNGMSVACFWDEKCGDKSEQQAIDMLRELLTRLEDACV